MSAAGTKRKAHTALDEVDENGNFKRTAAGFSHTVAPGGRFPPEAGRYRLYVALGCPWANGCLTALHLNILVQGVMTMNQRRVFVRARRASFLMGNAAGFSSYLSLSMV